MNHNLTPRETQVAQLLSQGLSNKQIGHHLGLTEHPQRVPGAKLRPAKVKNYCSSLYQKLGVQSRLQAALLLAFGNHP